MAINENILMQNLVPDLASSVAKGLAIGREIKEAPYRNRLLQLQTQQAEQQAQVAEMEKGLAQAQGVAALLGDMTKEDLLNPEVYNSVVSQLPTFTGVEVKPENQVVNHRSVDELLRMRDAAINSQRAARGSGFNTQFIGGGDTITKEIGVDDNGKPIYQNFKVITSGDRMTGEVSAQEIPIGGQFTGNNNPLISKRIAEEQAKSDIKVTEAGKKAEIEAGVKLRTEPEIQKMIVSAKESGRADAEKVKAVKTYEDMVGQLDRMEGFIDEGIYTGALGDKFVKAAASGGIVFDQDKLNRTTRVRQIATNLKFMAKPTGMGAMSDSEWKIIRDAIPDPDSATEGEIKAGLEEFRARLAERAGMEVEKEIKDTRTEEEILKEYGL